MRVADIYQQAKEFLGNCTQQAVFDGISDALELLNAKGEFDCLKCYLTISTVSGNLVTLPEFVEAPLKITINAQPSFSRDRIYEFSMNGPGSSAERTDYSWEDRGFVPTLVALTSASRLIVPQTASPENGLKLVVVGLDANNNEISETMILSSSAAVATTHTFAALNHIYKDATTNAVSLSATANGTTAVLLLSTYAANETEPRYRQIRLSKAGAAAHMLVRRKTFRVVAMDDFIPVQSRLGLMLMIKAVVAYRRTDTAVARAFEEDGARIATEAQRATTSFTDLAKDTETDSARGLNYNNRDSIIVADVYDDCAKIVGPIGQAKIFDKITEAVELLCNKGHWDGFTGYADIFTDGKCYVTLPRYVDAVIALNLGGRPMQMRNKWFEFHLNGPGSDCPTSCHNWDWVGDVPTIKPLQFNVQLVAIPDSNADDAKTIRIFGLDENSKPLGSGAGIVLTVDHTKLLPLAGDQKISRIDRITRESTAGFVRMLGYSIDQSESVILGYWYPDETEPIYTRIKLPTWSNWVRIRYRKRTLKIIALTDPLHLKSKIAIVRMLGAMEEKDPQKAEAMEAKATQWLTEEQASSNPGETFQVQFDRTWGSNCIIV